MGGAVILTEREREITRMVKRRACSRTRSLGYRSDQGHSQIRFEGPSVPREGIAIASYSRAEVH